MQKLYLAPGQLLDYCDASGCLPGQVPLKGVSHGSYTPKAVSAQMSQVCFDSTLGLTTTADALMWQMPHSV